jgi:hypothetical protein
MMTKERLWGNTLNKSDILVLMYFASDFFPRKYLVCIFASNLQIQRDRGQRSLKYIFLFLACSQKRSKERSGDGLVASTLVGLPSMMAMNVFGTPPPLFIFFLG